MKIKLFNMYISGFCLGGAMYQTQIDGITAIILAGLSVVNFMFATVNNSKETRNKGSED